VAVVVDASVAVAWFLRSQATPLTLSVREFLVHEIGWVPNHFGIDVGRSLRLHERRKLITSDFVDEALEILRGIPLRQDVVETLALVAPIVTLARRHTLRIADAAYLELALRLGLPLATRDVSLARAAPQAGVALFTP
jgi:predicted nucleic acid-binding protein